MVEILNPLSPRRPALPPAPPSAAAVEPTAPAPAPAAPHVAQDIPTDIEAAAQGRRWREGRGELIRGIMPFSAPALNALGSARW